MIAGLGELASPTDRSVLTGEFADYMAAAFRAAVRGGIAGWRDDDLAFTTDWGFSLGWDQPQQSTADTVLGPENAAAPVAIWQGDQDLMVPYAHGQWLAAHITRARAHLLSGQGHLTLTVTNMDQILDDLLDLAGLTA
jgi:pimeloyl-ACP methyl ester carboxylesterase